MTGRILSRCDHRLQITDRRSSWPLVLIGVVLVGLAMGWGI